MLMACLSALLVFVLLTASALLGRFIGPRLPEDHRKRETIEAMQIIIGIMVTFTALVLGLLTASVKTAYDHAGHDLQEYSLDLTRLDRCLRNYGPDADAVRDIIKSCTAALIASTWTTEPPPLGVQYPNVANMPRVGPNRGMSDMLNRAYLEIRHLNATDAFHAGVREDCVAAYQTLRAGRRAAIEDDSLQISSPFEIILIVWLMIIFAVFGLVSPRNLVSLIGIGLCGVSLSLAILVITSLNHPYFTAFPSDDMRWALAAMMAPEP